MNSVNIIGRLTRDPESRDVGGKQVATFSVAINEGKDKAIFIDVTAWEKTAQLVCSHFTKGSQIGVNGRLSVDQWEDRETGAKRTKVYVTASRITFVGSRQAPQQAQAAPQAPAFKMDDDMGSIDF